MKQAEVIFIFLAADGRKQFIQDDQWAFKYGVLEKFAERNDRINYEEKLLSRKTFEHCIDAPNRAT